MDLKTVIFEKLDYENIISINTDTKGNFSAVDAEGNCYHIVADTEE